MARMNWMQAILWLGTMRTRTWLILSAVGLLLIGLVVWTGIALLSWLWAQAPAVTEQAKRLAGEASLRFEQVAPALKEEVQQWVPAEVKEQAGKWLPGIGEDLPARDVSGSDLGPVPRFPGLLRSHFARTAQSVEVRYVGRADFATVLAHYVQGFADAGFAQEVIAATPDEEQHQFSRGKETIQFTLMRHPGDSIEVRLQHEE